jgi:hypothetical protein
MAAPVFNDIAAFEMGSLAEGLRIFNNIPAS